HRLQQSERPDAVGSVAPLEAPEQLALIHGQHRQDDECHQEDHQRLDDLDPPRLEVVDVGDVDHGLRTSITRSVSALAESLAIPSARNAVPAGTPVRTAAVAFRRVPFWETWTASPLTIPSRAASSGASSTCWWATVKCSAGEISTSGAAQIGR